MSLYSSMNLSVYSCHAKGSYLEVVAIASYFFEGVSLGKKIRGFGNELTTLFCSNQGNGGR